MLYGLNWAKADIVAGAEAVVCEGYTDVIAFFVAGVPRAVATCGTALAEDHLRVLRNFAPNLVLAYDADDAGQAAAEQDLPVGGQLRDPPVGGRPARRAGPGRCRPGRPRPAGGGGDGARPFLQFRLERLLRAADLASVEGRAAAAKAAVALIGRAPRRPGPRPVPDVAGRPGRHRRRPAPPRRPRRAPGRPDPSGRRGAGRRRRRGPARRPVDRPEVEALRVAVHEPALVADRLDPALFADPVVREAFEALAASATFHEALERAGGEVHDL